MALQAAFLQMITGRLVSLGVMAAGFATLGRLLDPAAFGYFAVAAAVYGIAEVLVQFGLRQLVISHNAGHTKEEIAAAAGLSCAIAVVLCILGLGVAWGAGDLLPAPVTGSFVPLSLALLIVPFTLGPEAMLQRALHFGLVSIGGVIGVCTEVAVSVSLAFAGYGAVALAWGFFVSQCAMAAFVITAAGSARRVWPSFGAWRHLLGWGTRMTVVQVLPKISEFIVLGSLSVLQSAGTVGLFNRARTIHQLLDRTLLEGIKPVVLPAFSAALRDGVDPARLYRVKLEYMSAVCWPGFALIALLADPLVRVLLGTGWDDAVPAVQILALMGIGLPVTKMSQKFFVALNEMPLYLRIEATREAVRVPLALVGAAISLPAFALAYVAGNLIKATGVMRHLNRRIGGPEGGYRSIAGRAGALTVAALIGPVAIRMVDLSPLTTLALALPLALLGWICAVMVLGHPISEHIRGLTARARQATFQRSGRK